MFVMRAAGVVAALMCGGCGAGKPTTRTTDYVPIEYHQYLRDGKLVPGGNPTLDYWVHVNVSLTTLKGPRTDLTLPGILRALVKFIREKPTPDVDPDVVRWADGVAGVLATKADILDQLNDPGTLRRAKEEVAAGRPNPLDTLDRASRDWEQERNRVVAEGADLQESLSQRHRTRFPPPQL